MKFIFVLVISLLGVSYNLADDDEIEEFLKTILETSRICTEETGVTRESLLELLKGHMPDSREAKCYVSCFMKRLKLENEDGTFHKEQALKEFEKFKSFNDIIYEKAVHVLEVCSEKAVSTGDACENAAVMAQCIFSTAKENGLDKEMARAFSG